MSQRLEAFVEIGLEFVLDNHGEVKVMYGPADITLPYTAEHGSKTLDMVRVRLHAMAAYERNPDRAYDSWKDAQKEQAS